MNNTPQYRQQWILEELKKSPLLSYGEMWGKYEVNWGKTFSNHSVKFSKS